MLSIEPKISDLVCEQPPTQLALQLECGRNQFRSAEVYVITKEIAAWGTGVPKNKQLRRFSDDVCGRLCVLRLVTGLTKCMSVFTLLPAPLRSGRTDAGLDRARDGLRAFRIPVTHNDFPTFESWMEGEQRSLIVWWNRYGYILLRRAR